MNRKKPLITEENCPAAESAASSSKAKVAKLNLDEIENDCHQNVEEYNTSKNNCNGNETHLISESVTTFFASTKPELNKNIFCEEQEQQLCNNFLLKSDYGRSGASEVYCQCHNVENLKKY